MGWSETFLQVLKDNDVRLITYGPDNVLTPPCDPALVRNRFMKGLGVGRAGASDA